MFEAQAKDKTNAVFNTALRQCDAYLDSLLSCPPQSMSLISSKFQIPAIYALFEGRTCLYVGRTRNLSQRLRGHKARNTYSASFAVKKAREECELLRNYKAGNSAKTLLETNELFQKAFDSWRERISEMEFRFVEIDDPIHQYFFEPYATMCFGLDEAAFDTY